jgi:hypothetical protein
MLFVVAVGQNPTARPTHELVHPQADPNANPPHAPRHRRPVGRFHDQMQMTVLQRIVDQPKSVSLIANSKENAANNLMHSMCSQRKHYFVHPHRYMQRPRFFEHPPSCVADVSRKRLRSRLLPDRLSALPSGEIEGQLLLAAQNKLLVVLLPRKTLGRTQRMLGASSVSGNEEFSFCLAT